MVFNKCLPNLSLKWLYIVKGTKRNIFSQFSIIVIPVGFWPESPGIVGRLFQAEMPANY
jgi:hypothetical protein